MDNRNVTGMYTNTVSIIKDNLHDRYDSGYPVLKELIQNANDSNAHKLLITKSEGIKQSSYPLLRKKALIVFNDGAVSDSDIEGLISVAQGGKRGRSGVIGKFGLGMKSIFHFADMFFYVAFRSDNINVRSVNPYVNIATNKDCYHEDWNNFTDRDCDLLKFESNNILKDKLGSNMPKDGLLLWIPLRDGTYNNSILNDIYDINNIWKLSTEELKKNIAYSLVSLDISTPCNNSSRTLEEIKVENGPDTINLSFPIGSNSIIDNNSDKQTEAFCTFEKKIKIQNATGEELLKSLLDRHAFSESTYINDNGETVQEIGYDANQKVSLAILKFNNNNYTKSININWCSYLPLDSNADICFEDDSLDSEYHILVHAHFAIDSGRKSIVDFANCVSYDKEININEISDDKTAQGTWNAILIRNYILPQILSFSCTFGELFIASLYKALCLNKTYSDLGYLCLLNGFSYKRIDNENTEWDYQEISSVQDFTSKLLIRANEYFSHFSSLKDKNYYDLLLFIASYIEKHATNLDWAILKASSNITNNELVTISEIASNRNDPLPILFIPKDISINYNSFNGSFTSSEVIIKYLLNINDKLPNKVGEIFSLLCKTKCITSEFKSQIFSDPMVKQSLPLFKLGKVNKNDAAYIYEFKTYEDVVQISKDLRLFSSYGVTEQNNKIQTYAQIFKDIELFIMSIDVAETQLNLVKHIDSDMVRYDNTDIVVYNNASLHGILKSMNNNNHIDLISHENVNACTRFIQMIQNSIADDNQYIDEYKDLIRAILIGHKTDSYQLYKIIATEENIDRAEFYINILQKYTQSNINNHIINSNIEISTSLYKTFDIAELSCDKLEARLGNEKSSLINCSSEEKIKLAQSLENEDAYKELPIHKTLRGDFVSLDINYKNYIENPKVELPPLDYVFPENVNILVTDIKQMFQNKVVRPIQYSNIVNIILCDDNVSLTNPNSKKINNYIIDIFKSGNIEPQDLVPNARKKRWIEGYNFEYYSINEIINNPIVKSDIVEKCRNIILYDSLPDDKKIPKEFLNENDNEILKILINSNDGSWPWFNLKSYNSLTEDVSIKSKLDLLRKSEDPLVDLLIGFKGESGNVINYYDNLTDLNFSSNHELLQKNILSFIINICRNNNEGDNVPDFEIKFIAELFNQLENPRDFIQKVKNEEHICLPADNKKWQNINELVNFGFDIPDLRKENSLNHLLKDFFDKQNKRSGDETNSKEISSDEFINIISTLKHNQLWGVFSYCILPTFERSKIYDNAKLMDADTSSLLRNKKMNVNKLHLYLHETQGNFCNSITGRTIGLSSDEDSVSVFYNYPVYDEDTREMQIELFNNFDNFDATQIRQCIKNLITNTYGLYDFDDKFYDNLTKPDQLKIKFAINTIFNSIFSTLKFLKLSTKAGSNNQIANNWQQYNEATGNDDLEGQHRCISNIKTLITRNDGNIHQKIRDNVVKFIEEAEYQEECILFELFQNADDSYCQGGTHSDVPYFSVEKQGDSILCIKHCGRPINQYRSGTNKEYSNDLVNMLSIGWSDKRELDSMGKLTGKFGYGFKTVYLISDEPHIQSGEYDFTIKAALYPEPSNTPHSYTDETIITLPLNDNGLEKVPDILASFDNAAKYMVMFSKKIHSISVNHKNYSWTPKKSYTLANHTIELSDDFILFTLKKEDNVELARLAFRRYEDKVIPFDDSKSKVWNLTPLADWPNMGFAISADFKTNTGRQTLAINQDYNLLNEIAISFADLLELIYSGEKESDLKNFLPSLINVLFIGSMKTQFIEPIPLTVLNKFKRLGLIPDGYNRLYEYKNLDVYTFSSSYFNDHIKTQNEKIRLVNDFIQNNTNDNLLIISNIIGDQLRENIHQYKNIKIINVIDMLLSNNKDLNTQKGIVLALKNTELLDFILKQKEQLSTCKLYNQDNELQSLNNIVELSDDYGEAKDILKKLFQISWEASQLNFNNNIYASPYQEENFEDDEDDDFDKDSNQNSYKKFTDTFNSWRNATDEEWTNLVNSYYETFYPDQFDYKNLKNNLIIKDEEKYYESNKMPEEWCLFLLVCMCQNMVAFNHTNTTNKKAVKWLYETHLISDFCSGESLETLYDSYLNNQKGTEMYLKQFEALLRLYKLRKNFLSFYNHLIQIATKSNLDSVTKILDISTDPDMSGSGVYIPSCIKSLGFGIHTIIRDLLLFGFYGKKDNQAKENLRKFAYTPRKRTCYQVVDSVDKNNVPKLDSVEIYTKVNEKLNEICSNSSIKTKFLDCFDLPLIIFAK